MEDFTRNIQRKKEKELAELQFSAATAQANRPQAGHERRTKVGRNDPALRQRQEIQEVPRPGGIIAA